MIVYPLPAKLVRKPHSILDALSGALTRQKIRLRKGDVIAISSKVVAMSEGRLKDITDVGQDSRTEKLAREYSIPTSIVKVIVEEADQVLGGVRGALLTIKDGNTTANAGIDRKNAPPGSVVLWPDDPDSSARRIRDFLYRRFARKIGVVIVDSRVTPLRLGTIGFAIGCAGFQPVRDLRGTVDLYGRRIKITRHAVADGIAAAAHLVIGEGRERIPFALVRGVDTRFQSRSSMRFAKMAPRDCLYMSQIPRLAQEPSRGTSKKALR